MYQLCVLLDRCADRRYRRLIYKSRYIVYIVPTANNTNFSHQSMFNKYILCMYTINLQNSTF